MSQVFRDAVIRWNGEYHRLSPDVNLLRRIKGQGINNLRLAQECMTVGPDPSEMAVVMRLFLQAAGVRVSDDECYGFMLDPANADAVAEFMETYVQAVVPGVDLGKKPEAPDQPQAKPGPKKAKKKI